jgi:hypothetical protein
MRIFILFFIVIQLFASDINVTDNNISNDINNSDMLLDLPELNEENITIQANPEINRQSMNIAIILDKNKFFKFIPNILNSINAYMIKKDIDYNITLFNQDENLTKELNEITPKYKYIFTYFTNADQLNVLENYPKNYFFVPTLNKKQSMIDSDNIFFGGIDYENQVNTLNQFISGKTFIIYDNSNLSKYITTLVDETLEVPHVIRKYPVYYSKDFNKTFVYLNTNIVNTAQILANFTYHEIETKSIVTTQISYSPFIFALTNSDDVQNLILANSIFNINPVIEDNNLNLGTDIDFNWLNFTTSTLLNVAYNLETKDTYYYLNDFDLYIYFNQVEYKTNLYRIFQNGFIKIEN